MSFYSLYINSSGISVLYNGVLLGQANSIDFTGAGQNTTILGTEVTVNIPGGTGGTQIVGEILGTGDGVTTIFIFAHTPNPSFIAIYLGLRETPGLTQDYTISGNQITFTTAPAPGQKIIGDYSY